MVMLAVTDVSDALTMPPLMSGLLEITVDAVARPVPLKTTSKLSPRSPLSGVTRVITGAAGVKSCVVKLAMKSLARPLPARSRMPLARMRIL